MLPSAVSFKTAKRSICPFYHSVNPLFWAFSTLFHALRRPGLHTPLRNHHNTPTKP